MNSSTRPKSDYFIALDLGTKLGYVVDNTIDIIKSGTIHFRKRESKYNDYESFLCDLINNVCKGSCACIYYEKVRAHRGVDAAHMYGGFEAILQKLASSFNIPFVGIPVKTIKKAITGNGNANKIGVMLSVKEHMGIDPVDDNHADALAISYYVRNYKES